MKQPTKTNGLIVCVFLASLLISGARASNADIVHDFTLNPITWSPSTGPLAFDSDGDFVDDFEVSIDTGFIDSDTGLYVIDNLSTSSAGIEKTFVFSVTSLAAGQSVPEFNLLGFDFFSQKNIEPGGKGGAGAISVDVFDDSLNELVNSLGATGSLGSNPTSVTLGPSVSTRYFVLAIDLGTPPNNDDAQVILGDFVFNAGTVESRTIAAAEPTMATLLLVGSIAVLIRRRPRALKE